MLWHHLAAVRGQRRVKRPGRSRRNKALFDSRNAVGVRRPDSVLGVGTEVVH